MNSGFIAKYKNILKNEFDDFYSALNRGKRNYFRLNKVRAGDYLSELGSYSVEELDGFFSGMYRYDNYIEPLSASVSFLTGGLYIQNPSSYIPARILASLMDKDPFILDVSASPGGKTTALSELTERGGLIVANEPSKQRLKALNFNLERCGAWNVKTISLDGRLLHRYFSDKFDGVLLDAPCSNENKIGRNDEVDRTWCDDLVDKMQKLQKELILSAFDTLKEGGCLVYSTCTFSIEENENVIEYLLSNRESARLVNINNGLFTTGISSNSTINENVVRVMPHKSDYDGFFVAAVMKGEKKVSLNHHYKKEKIPKYILEKFKYFDKSAHFTELKEFVLMESPFNIDFHYHKTGIKAGKLIKDRLEVASQFLWENGDILPEDYRIQINHQQAIEYLKGCDIFGNFSQNGFGVYLDSIPVGIIKHVAGSLKNKLDRYFLYGRQA